MGVSDSVSHRGIVEKVGYDFVVVKVKEDDCNCEGCSITALCTGRSVEGPLLTVKPCPRAADRFKAGDRVRLTASSGSTLFSSFWLFIVPLVILVAIVLFGASEDWGIWSVIAGVGAMLVYDAVLFSFRRRLASRIRWDVTIE